MVATVVFRTCLLMYGRCAQRRQESPRTAIGQAVLPVAPTAKKRLGIAATLDLPEADIREAGQVGGVAVISLEEGRREGR